MDDVGGYNGSVMVIWEYMGICGLTRNLMVEFLILQ